MARRIDGHGGRTIEEGRGGRDAAARLRPARGPFEFRRDVLVRVRGGLSAVPGPAVGINPRIGDLRQHPVRLLAILQGGRPVDSRTYQRVAKPDPRPERDQAGRLRVTGRAYAEAELRRGPPHQGRIASRLRGRDQQQEPGRRGQAVHPPQEAVLDPSGQR